MSIVAPEFTGLSENPNIEEVVAFMKESLSDNDWNKRCDEVKVKFWGNYPDFWYKEIILWWVRPCWKKPSSSDIIVETFNLPKEINMYGRPMELPFLKEWEKLICGFDNGLGEKNIICETLEDAQALYDKYAQGWALRIKWYVWKID